MRLAQLVPTHNGSRPANAGHMYSEGCAWVRVRGSFSPDLIEAQEGERLRLVFRREETAPCSEQVVIPSLGKSVMLPPFEDVAVELGPLPPGEHEFSCGLGVLRGRILARGHAANGSVVSTESTAALVPDGGGPRGSAGPRRTRSDRHRSTRSLPAVPEAGLHAPIPEEANMSVLDHRKTSAQGRLSHLNADQHSQPEREGGHRGHSRWMMIACCVPMLAIAIVLVATGVVGAGFIVAALACTLMMALMMVGMSHGDGGGR